MHLNASPLQELDLSYYGINNQVYIKRDDLIHDVVSGNKWRKLKYNLQYFQSITKKGIISMGGAYSSHILALSYICKQYNIPCTLLVRGEPVYPINNILKQCLLCNATIKYVNREKYRDNYYINHLIDYKYQDLYFIPEGGANYFGIYGCQKITKEIKIPFDLIFCEVGTGATFSGIVSSLKIKQKCFGTVVLKGAQKIQNDIFKTYQFQMKEKLSNNQFILSHDYHFGGYAKYNKELILFIKEFYKVTGIKTDPIYSGKLFYSLVDQLRKNKVLKDKTVVALHSGGISGIKGFEERYKVQIFS